MRYRIDLSYHGGAFHGWQKQPDLRTVQGELELWLGRFLNSPSLAVTGAGRTDSGVHAERMTAHFDADEVPDPGGLCARLNAALPDDISALSISQVADDFHARYGAIEKTYEYRLTVIRSPFERDRIWLAPRPFDLNLAQSAAQEILGERDFSGFCLATSRRENNICRVTCSEWAHVGTEFRYRVTANRFLHEMVRLLVGVMAEIARGTKPPQTIRTILETGDIALCGNAAPPHGLTLIGVEYPS